jgi:hypothetical protein
MHLKNHQYLKDVTIYFLFDSMNELNEITLKERNFSKIFLQL